MTRVLLIADTERVQRIFQLLQEKGVLQLQTASTLTLGELELSETPPEVTFVQSRISGFSGEILLRHLDKILPKGAKLVLMAGDDEDAAQAKRHGRQSLDLSLGDDLLEQTIGALLIGAPLPAGAAGEATPAEQPGPAKVATPAPLPLAAREQEQGVEPVPAEPPADLPPQQPERPEAEEQPASTLLQPDEKVEPLPFDEVMRRASATVGPLKTGLLENKDRGERGKGAPLSVAAFEAAQRPAGAHGEGDEDLRMLFAGETLADAMRRAERNKKSRSPYLIILPALVLIAIPLISYLAGQRTAPDPQKTAPISKAKPAPSVPATVPSSAAPAGKQPATPATGATAQPVAKPAAKTGLEKLPPMLEGTRLDADYGKSHPGWVRYIGLRAEYKLFKENNLFRAMQVMAVGGGTVSEELFKRVLLEFGGIGGYRVESSATKGDFLVEQCATQGNTALTIYRNKKTLKIKALVVYYR